jgi:hypothetical protein
MRNTIKEKIPIPLWDLSRNLWFMWQHAKLWPAANLHPARIKSKNQLSKFKNIHQGKRCFIIGNGPSLKKTDISKLKNEYTFGMNRIYLAFPNWGFETNYFVSINDLVIEQCAQEIAALTMPKFLAWHARPHIDASPSLSFVHTTYTGPTFSKNIKNRVWESATVTYVAMQLAYYMGFSEVILIGVDHKFKSKGTPNTTIVSQGDDEDHFDARYFGKGYRWQLPDLETSEIGYQLAKGAFENDDRRIVDATVDGKLTVFPKVPFDSLF